MSAHCVSCSATAGRNCDRSSSSRYRSRALRFLAAQAGKSTFLIRSAVTSIGAVLGLPSGGHAVQDGREASGEDPAIEAVDVALVGLEPEVAASQVSAYVEERAFQPPGISGGHDDAEAAVTE